MADIILLCLLLAGGFWGYKSGIVTALSSVGAAIGGLWVARNFAPKLVELLGVQIAATSAGGFWQQLFMAPTAGGKLLEGIAYLVTFFAAFFVIRLLAHFLGSVTNALPIIGFLGRIAGGLVGVLLMATLLYFLGCWLLPLFNIEQVNTFFASATKVMPYIRALGDTLYQLVATGQLLLPEATNDLVWGTV